LARAAAPFVTVAFILGKARGVMVNAPFAPLAIFYAGGLGATQR